MVRDAYPSLVTVGEFAEITEERVGRTQQNLGRCKVSRVRKKIEILGQTAGILFIDFNSFTKLPKLCNTAGSFADLPGLLKRSKSQRDHDCDDEHADKQLDKRESGAAAGI